jgi:hypothetical protein
MFKRMVVALALLTVASPVRALGMGPHWFPEYVESPRELSIVYVDVEDAAPFAQAGLARETSRVLSGLGIEVHWRQGGLGVVARPGELTVVLLGHVSTRSAIRPDVLGATIVKQDGARAVWVYLPHVAAILGLDAERVGSWTGAEVSQLATALGRVAAHELLHALAPALRHASGGLMAERLGRAALLGPNTEVSPEFQRALRPALLRHASND